MQQQFSNRRTSPEDNLKKIRDEINQKKLSHLNLSQFEGPQIGMVKRIVIPTNSMIVRDLESIPSENLSVERLMNFKKQLETTPRHKVAGFVDSFYSYLVEALKSYSTLDAVELTDRFQATEIHGKLPIKVAVELDEPFLKGVTDLLRERGFPLHAVKLQERIDETRKEAEKSLRIGLPFASEYHRQVKAIEGIKDEEVLKRLVENVPKGLDVGQDIPESAIVRKIKDPQFLAKVAKDAEANFYLRSAAIRAIGETDLLIDIFRSVRGFRGVVMDAYCKAAAKQDEPNNSVLLEFIYTPGVYDWNIASCISDPAILRTLATDLNDSTSRLNQQLSDTERRSGYVAGCLRHNISSSVKRRLSELATFRATRSVVNTTSEIPEHIRDRISSGTSAGFVVGPKAIEKSEAVGQRQLVEGDVLPSEIKPSKEAFEALGFVFGEKVSNDPIFIAARLPEGWTIQAAPNHSMWSHIQDTSGRPRVDIFYKASFHDRRANMRIVESER